MGFKQGITFVNGKVKNFKNLTSGEQISYSSVGMGLVLVLVGIFLLVF